MFVIGRQIGPYQVVDKIGAGGMGEVYRATDTNLKRDVAIKVLPDAVAADPERLARFQREAQLLAALNHPNIAQIYGVERSPRALALVMELVEGPTLADRLVRGPMPVDDGLAIARQIAEALETAHEQGIIHRDLKPANIKIREDGTVKVLDFGLAKVIEPARASGDIGLSPTVTSPALTERGVILGTASYMSPEQARGRPVDTRTDIWAFGCVLYEMLTGRRAFAGEDVSDTLAAVIRGPINWNALPAGMPPPLRSFLIRCLDRDVKQRVGSMQDVRLALEGAFDVAAPTAAPPHKGGWSSRRVALLSGAAFVAGAMTVALTAPIFVPPEPSRPVTRSRYAAGDYQSFGRRDKSLAISPDGRSIVYTTTQGLYLRHLNELEGQLIAGTDEHSSSPVFAPDARSIAFFSLASGQVKRIEASGGVAVPIVPAVAPRGMSWEGDGTLLIAQPSGILRATATGGTATTVIAAGDGETLRSPQLLPDARTVLFSSAREGTSSVVVQSVPGNNRKVIVAGADNPRYLPTGHLIYTVGSDLFGVAFDPARLTATGPATPLRARVWEGVNFAASGTGTLIYVQSSASTRGTPVLVDRAGAVVRRLAPAPLDRPRHPAVDPAGERVALVAGPSDDARLWFYPLDGGPPARGASLGRGEIPVWSPGSEQLALGYSDGDQHFVYVVEPGHLSKQPVRIASGPRVIYPQAWSANGEIVVMRRTERPDQTDLLAVSVHDPATTRALAARPEVNEYHGRLSPNGRWLAYGHWFEGIRALEIHVRDFSGRGDPIVVATDGGNMPLWSRDGRELFYVRQQQIMAMPVDTESPTFSYGPATPLFSARYQFSSFFGPGPLGNLHTYYDVDPRRQFVLIEPEAEAVPREITIVQNWQEELKRLVPTP